MISVQAFIDNVTFYWLMLKIFKYIIIIVVNSYEISNYYVPAHNAIIHGN